MMTFTFVKDRDRHQYEQLLLKERAIYVELMNKAEHLRQCLMMARKSLKSKAAPVMWNISLCTDYTENQPLRLALYQLQMVVDENSAIQKRVMHEGCDAMRRQSSLEQRRALKLMRYNRVRRVWFLLHNDKLEITHAVWDQLVDEFFAMAHCSLNRNDRADEECAYIRSQFGAERFQKGRDTGSFNKWRTDGVILLKVAPPSSYRERFALEYYRLAKRLRKQKSRQDMYMSK